MSRGYVWFHFPTWSHKEEGRKAKAAATSEPAATRAIKYAPVNAGTPFYGSGNTTGGTPSSHI